MLLMGKSTLSTIFNSYVQLQEANWDTGIDSKGNHGIINNSYPVVFMEGAINGAFGVPIFPKKIPYSMGSCLELRIEFPNHQSERKWHNDDGFIMFCLQIFGDSKCVSYPRLSI